MTSPFLAEIIIFAGNFASRGWAMCNGQLLPISQNTALFSLLGTTYGGDGRTNFALPNSGLTYGAPVVSGASGLTGTVNCSIDGSSNLNCTAGGPVELAAGGSFDVVIGVTPLVGGPYANPRAAGSCAVDPGGMVIESNEGNNTAGNSVTVNSPPTITSGNNTAFTVGSAGSFTVTTVPGYPVAMSIGEAGALPAGMTFTDNGDGTATLAGTPAAGTGGTYPILITASNGVLPNATQNFTLTVGQTPAITSANNTAFTTGSAGSFTVTTNGYPVPAITLAGALPAGVTFTDNLDGTATLAGTPAAGSGGVYPITITASNGITPDATQNFTLTVNQAPAITSANNTAFATGSAGSFTVTTTGFPTGASMSIGEVGALPAGVTFTDNGDGTATLAGTPAAGTGGTYPIVITASNGILPDATQNFTLTIDSPELTAVKSNDVGGSTILPDGWVWTIHVSNTGTGYAAFTDGDTILTDSLPDSGLTYSIPAVSGAVGLTGTVNCAIEGGSSLTCTAVGPVQLAAGGSFDVVFTATPGASGSYANPRPAGSCAVDPESAIAETEEGNNTCSDDVVVNPPPPPGAFSKTGPADGAYAATNPTLTGVQAATRTNTNTASTQSTTTYAILPGYRLVLPPARIFPAWATTIPTTGRCAQPISWTLPRPTAEPGGGSPPDTRPSPTSPSTIPSGRRSRPSIPQGSPPAADSVR